MNLKWLLAASAIGVCCGFGAPANATTYNPITWTVTGTFDDGGTLSGMFTLNSYGYLVSASVTTTAGTTLPGLTYTVPGFQSNIIPPTPPPDGIDLYDSYNEVLQLVFDSSLEIPGSDALNLGVVSFECNSFSCPPGGTDFVDTRYFTSGAAASALSSVATPLPATLPLMGTVLGAFYLITRRRRLGASPVAA